MIKSPTPDSFEVIKSKFDEIKQEFSESENLRRVTKDHLVKADWKVFESFLNLKENYKKDVEIVSKEILKKGIVNLINTRREEIKKEEREQ